MLFSLNFLHSFITLPKKKQHIELADAGFPVYEYFSYDLSQIEPLLVRQGFEVEKVHQFGDSFHRVILGKVLSTKKHPDADKLNICEVLVQKKTHQVVCGAPNVRAGLFVAYALPGATLPDLKNSGKTWELVEKPIRGQSSFGMLCGKDELGIPLFPGENSDGIWEIENVTDTDLGKPIFDVLGWRDTLLEVGVTPNRADCLCHQGLARELQAGFQWQKIGFQIPTPFWKNQSTVSAENLLKLAQQNSGIPECDFVPEFSSSMRGFFLAFDYIPKPTPAEIFRFLFPLGEAVGIDLVDISNFILLGFGHPSHAYDLDSLENDPKLGQKVLTIRPAFTGESFLALDQKTYTCTEQDIVVADATQVHGLLGVIGGDKSKIKASTRKVVVEFVHPNPVTVRQSARRHGRHTAAAFAFEKGIDHMTRFLAAHTFLNCLSAQTPKVFCCSPTILGKSALHPESLLFLDSNVENENLRIIFSDDLVLARTGSPLADFSQQKEILKSLGFLVLEKNSHEAWIQPPHWRWNDVRSSQDLVEEITRMVGVDQVKPIPFSLSTAATHPQRDDSHWDDSFSLRAGLVSCGYYEVVGLHFMGEQELQKLALQKNDLGLPIELLNPIAQNQGLMQTTLIPNLLTKVAFNQNHQKKSGQLFELARTYQDATNLREPFFNKKSAALAQTLHDYDPKYSLNFWQEQVPAETLRLAGVVFGNQEEKNWDNLNAVAWELPAVLSHLLSTFALLRCPIEWKPLDNHPYKNALHPGQCVQLFFQQQPIGWAGTFHPQVLRNWDIKVGSLGFEVNLSSIFKRKLPSFQLNLPEKFPVVERDLAFWVDKHLPYAELKSQIFSLFPREKIQLKELSLFDIFVQDNKKSFGLKLKFSAPHETLAEEIIRVTVQEIVKRLEESCSAKLRS